MKSLQGNARILLADDEEEIRFACETALRMSGYDVVVATDGSDTVAKLADDARNFDLVVTDLQMPAVGGGELIKKIIGIDFAPPILVMSGFPRPGTTSNFSQMGLAGYLEKPFEISELLEAVEGILNPPPAL